MRGFFIPKRSGQHRQAGMHFSRLARSQLLTIAQGKRSIGAYSRNAAPSLSIMSSKLHSKTSSGTGSAQIATSTARRALK